VELVTNLSASMSF